MKRCWIGLMLVCGATVAFAQTAATPIGLWRTIDDETGKEKAYVRIAESKGALFGKIEKLLNPPVPDPRCDRCTDERKGQPIVGLTILRGVRRDGDGTWDGGDILDPATGQTYSVILTPEDGGRALKVRGYVGVPMLGRSQTWLRVE